MRLCSRLSDSFWKATIRLSTVSVLAFVAATTLIQSASCASTEQVERYALLIGIDQYAQPSNPVGRFEALNCPRNDVELIGKLLKEKYDFKEDAEHIVILLGSQATRSAIAQAFEVHLLEHAKAHPGAIVVFYFSGHGSQANKVAPGDTSWHDTLVAYDSRAWRRHRQCRP